MPLATFPGRLIPPTQCVLHACPPLRCSGQESRKLHQGPTLPQLPSYPLTPHRNVPPPKRHRTLPFVPPICCPHQASCLPWCLWPTLPFKADVATVAQGASCSLCSGFAWSPTCPAPLVSRPRLPEPRALHVPSCPAQHHLIRGVHPGAGQPCHQPRGPVSPSCSQKVSLPVTPVPPHFPLPPEPRLHGHQPGPSLLLSRGPLGPPFLSPFCHQPTDLQAQLSTCPRVSRHSE